MQQSREVVKFKEKSFLSLGCKKEINTTTSRLTYNCAHLRSTKECLTIEYFEKEIIFFVEKKKKNVEGKGGNYLEKEKIFCGGEEEQRRKRRKIFGERRCHRGRTNNEQGKWVELIYI